MFIIESVQTKHIAGLHCAVDAVSREGLYFSGGEAAPVEAFTTWINENLRIGCAQFVAISTEGIVGWCIIHQSEYEPLRHSGCLFIGMLPHWRGRGIGTQLMRAALGKAWRNGLNRIHLDVYADNDSAISLYRKFGFADEGVKRCAHFRNGRYWDVLNMAVLAEELESQAMGV